MKRKIFFSVIFVEIVFFGVFFLPSFFAEAAGLVPCGGTTEKSCTLCHLFVGIQNVINWGMKILTVLAFVILVAAAIMYIVSAGNTSTIDAAKSAIKNTLIGFAIVLLAWVIINTAILLLPLNKDVVKGDWWQITCDTDRLPPGNPPTGGSGEVNTSGEKWEVGLKVSPTNVEFRNVEKGKESVLATITLENTNSFFDIDITENITVESSSGEFFLRNNKCPGKGGEIKYGTSCTFDVGFRPTTCTAEQTGVAVVKYNGSYSTEINLKGICLMDPDP